MNGMFGSYIWLCLFARGGLQLALGGAFRAMFVTSRLRGARMPTERGYSRNDDDSRSFERRYGGVGREVSHFCQAWMTAGANALVESTRAMADALEDLNGVFCKPEKNRDDIRKSR